MIEEIMSLMAADPFVPFTIVTDRGIRHFVESREHLAISPDRKWILVFFLDNEDTSFAASRVASIERGASAPAD